MSTLDLYMPTMREAPGRHYLPMRASLAALASAVLLVGGLTWAVRYPLDKAQEALARLATYNHLIESSNAGTQAALTRLQGLVNGQPDWLQKAVAPTVAAVREQLATAKPIDPTQILDAAAKQQAAYDQAQALIAASPFKGLKTDEVPLTAQGKAYLAALQAKPPARFDYQRLADGVGTLLTAYHAALQVQDQTVQFTHRIDVQLHGDKAAPAPAPVLDTSAAGLFHAPAALKADDDASVLRQLLDDAGRHGHASNDAPPKGDRLVPLGSARGYPDPAGQANTSSSPAAVSYPTPDPVGAAVRQQQDAAAQQQREAEQAKARAAAQEAARQRDAQRAALAAEKAKLQAKLSAEKAQLEAQQRAQQEARAKQEAAARAAAAAKAAAEAKKRECTSSIFARAKCMTEGYNPLTGEKRH